MFILRVIGFLLLIINVNLWHNYLWFWDEIIMMIIFLNLNLSIKKYLFWFCLFNYFLDLNILVDGLEKVKTIWIFIIIFVFSFYFVACSTDCTIEVRLAESFRIKKVEFNSIIIVRKIKYIFFILYFLLFFYFSSHHDQISYSSTFFYYISVVVFAAIYTFLLNIAWLDHI
jgi:hypothetical protein